MNRNELAKKLNVWPWDVDAWLLRGCPAKKDLSAWEFDLEKMKIWLVREKVKIKRARPQHPSTRPKLDQRWFKGRCPICIDKGFTGEHAGRVYTLGEGSDGEWHLRRTGIPCGHSAYLNPKEILTSSRAKDKKKKDSGNGNGFQKESKRVTKI